MPVSGNEETGVKPSLPLLPSLNIAGVPIKKRRFMWPPSPPPEERPSHTAEKDFVHKEHDSPSKASSPLKADASESSSGLSDVAKNFAPSENSRTPGTPGQQNTIMDTKVIEEPHLMIPSDSLSKHDTEKKLVEAERSVTAPIKSAESDLSLPPTEAPVPGGVKEGEDQLITDELCKSDMSTVRGNPELSLGLKEHHVFPSDNCCNSGSSQKHEGGEPLSLNFSLSNGESSTQSEMKGALTNTDSAGVSSNRLNWDLNLSMDAWEGSASGATGDQVTAIGSSTVDIVPDMKPPVCSTAVVGTGYATEKQLLGVSGCKTSVGTLLSQSSEQYNSEDSLNLRLSPSLLSLSSSQVPSSSPGKKDSGGTSNVILPRGLLTVGNVNMVSSRIKSEPLDESLKHDVGVAKEISTRSSEPSAVKPELAEKSPSEALQSSNSKSLKIGATSIKSEPLQVGNPERVNTMEGISCQSDEQVSQGQDTGGQNPCSTDEQPLQDQDTRQHLALLRDGQVPESQNATVKPASPTQLPVSITALNGEGASNNMLNGEGASPRREGPKEVCEGAVQLASEVVSPSVDPCSNELNVSARLDTGAGTIEENNADNTEPCKQRSDEFHPDSQKYGECPVSDEEKINLSGDMLEDSSCSFDYESDGNSVPMDIEEEHGGQDDYEDGEVREPQLDVPVEKPICKNGENINHVDSDDKEVKSSGLLRDDHPTGSNAEQKYITGEGSAANIEYSIKECVDTSLDGKTIEDAGKDSCEETSAAAGTLTNVVDRENMVMTIQKNPPDMMGKEDAFMDRGAEQSSDQATSGGQEALVASAHVSDEDGKRNVEKSGSASPKVEAALDEDKAKDTHNGGTRSRIINLSQASNFPSPGKTRSIPGRPLPSHSGRERLPDVPLEYDKLHPRGRDELYNDSFHKFSRDRHHDQFSRNTRFNFVHGRGRISGRIDTLRGSRDSGRDFAADFSGPSDFGVPRHKYTCTVAEADDDFINHDIGPDGSFVGNVRGGRKVLDDETSVFRHLSSRRRSPGGRDGPSSRGFPVPRRVPRNMDDSSEVIGVRHTEKIMRGFPEDGAEHAFTRPQPQFEGLDGHFIQGNRNFSSGQRRTLPQIHSKSPVRSRSPGPWSSTRRRSPGGFGGPQELHRRRSPMYRMERMRSPDHPGFPRETVVRRHGSPPYMSRPNDLREMDSDHLRPIMSNRSQNGRVLLRSNRRFISDPRDRTDSDELLGGAVHSGRFHELGSEGNGEERRRFADRRGPIRSFRPPFNANDGENFHLNSEDASRPFRFLSDDADFHGRANMREREFDRRIKNRPENAPRRPRSTEEQEGNYRQSGQVLYDDGFDDMSRVKRKRF